MVNLIGLELGNFTITKVLGEGGMATVYLAEHKWIARKKAIKVLNEDVAKNNVLVRRFFDEAMAASSCGHDHIVSIEDCGELDVDGVTLNYIEMEYLEGQTLSAACFEAGRMDTERAVKIAVYAADALAAAHERGIFHRDVKPENIFLARRGKRTDYVKVLDFGVARLTGEMSSVSRTKTGVIYGTVEYMSPEQALGHHIDAKSDVYSLGVVLYRMLTGRVPFAKDTVALFAIKVAHEKPPPLHALRPDVPDGVVNAVEKAMKKRADERPTMLQLKELLLAPDAMPRALSPELSIAAPVAAAGAHLHSAQTVILDRESGGRIAVPTPALTPRKRPSPSPPSPSPASPPSPSSSAPPSSPPSSRASSSPSPPSSSPPPSSTPGRSRPRR